MTLSEGVGEQDLYAIGQEIVSILGEDRDKRGRKIHTLPITEKRFVARIKNPRLLTDITKIIKIKPPTKRDTVFSLYQSYPRYVEYDGVWVWYDPKTHVDVWGPTSDTIRNADFSNRSGKVYTDDVETIEELCCGSGFLGKYAAIKCKNAKELHLVDIYKKAIQCAQDNMEDLEKQKDINVSYSICDARKMAGKKYNLINLNPPYILRQKTIEGSAFEGISLSCDIIENGRDFVTEGGKIVVTTSSISEDIVQDAMGNAKGLKSAEILGKAYQPLKVNPVLNNKDWVSYLLGEKRLERMKGYDYEYGHTITIWLLTYE